MLLYFSTILGNFSGYIKPHFHDMSTVFHRNNHSTECNVITKSVMKSLLPEALRNGRNVFVRLME